MSLDILMLMIFSWIRINSIETITSVFIHIPFVFGIYYLTDMIMSWYGNGFHITAPFVKEFHNTLVDSPHRGPVMQSFSVSFVVSLNKLLNQQFSCWWFERLCHCKVTHLYHIMILFAKYNFLPFCISFRLNTHTCYKTYFFVFNQFSPQLQQLLHPRPTKLEGEVCILDSSCPSVRMSVHPSVCL